jgi:hypothetical protein
MNSNHATVRKLEAMGLHGMARAFKSTMAAATGSSFTTDELISYLVDTEWDDRNNRKIARLRGFAFRLASSRSISAFPGIWTRISS